jgi:acid phosphatase (class A)
MKLKYYTRTAINEEWGTEAPVGTDWSFLPEEITSALNPNFLNVSQPPLGNLSVEGEEEEIQRILLLQEGLTEDDKRFIVNADQDLPSTYYQWLSLRGERPKMNTIKECGLTEEEKKIISKIKDGVKRPRPFVENKKIKSYCGKTVGYSYPSKTTTEAYVMCERLCEKYPQLREGLYALANKIATSRIQGGVHYPSDVEAGKSIAKGLLAK